MAVVFAPALGARLAAACMPCGPEAHRHPGAYAGAGSCSSSREDDVLRPLVLGSMGGRGMTADDAGRGAGRVAGGMEGDLSPQDWNQPDSPAARAAGESGRHGRAG
jgi:hypothetical protein